MATTRIKDKISAIVSSQLPEFIQSDYSTFVSFIEAYYKFLEQDQGALELVQNARSYADLDTTTDSFVDYFLNTYAKNIPIGVLGDKKLLIKRIKDLYESKGSELSFKLLFNLLFQQNVEVNYPYQNVLRASAGRWQQRVSVRVRTVSGNRNDILNRSLFYTNSGVDYNTPINETRILTENLTELFLDQNLASPTYTIGDTVYVRDANGNDVFVGTLDPTTTTYEIIRAGLGFKVGQIYTINAVGGVSTLIRVSNVSTTGEITDIKFVSYGYGFPDTIFSVDIDPNKNISETADILSDITQGFSETVTLYKYDPNEGARYFLEQYTDTNSYTYHSANASTTTTATAASSTSTKPPSYATIRFNVGALSRYPGSYVTNDSFISEADIRLEDDLLYQPFAYQTITQVDITEFFDIITQLIHPAGQRLFNNRLIRNSIDISGNVSVVSRSNIFNEALSVFDVLDQQSYNLAKVHAETANIVELAALTVSKPLSDNNISTSDVSNISIQPTFSDNVAPTEATVLDISIELSHASNVIEQATLTINKQINNTDSIVTITESANGTIQSYFAETDYVSELYVGSTFTLI